MRFHRGCWNAFVLGNDDSQSCAARMKEAAVYLLSLGSLKMLLTFFVFSTTLKEDFC